MPERYEIKEKIAQGGLGAVYLARDINLDREVALKRVLPEAASETPGAYEDLLKEAKTLSSLQHPNVVTVYDVGTDEEGPYVVMEYLKGETLDTTMKRGALPQADFEQLVTQCLEGLIAAQAVGLIHRDIKPGNIMVIWHASGKFQLKILDFGLAKFTRQPSAQTIDQDDSIMGSIYFMAPEQFERLELDGRTDLYSFGAIFYYTLTTQYPYQGDSAPQVMAAHLQHQYHPLKVLRPDLPEWIGQWLDWLMARQAKHRPTSAKEALAYFRKQSSRNEAEREAFAVELEKKLNARAAQQQQQKPSSQPATQVRPTPTGKLEAGPQPMASSPIAAAGQPSGKLVAGRPSTSSESQPLQTGASSAHLATGSSPEDAIAVAEYVEEEEPASKGVFASIPKWVFITVPLILLLGGGWAVKGLLERKAHNNRVERITQLAEVEKPQGSPEDVRLLVGFMEGGDHSSDEYSVQAASILSRLEGEGINEAIAKSIPLTQGDGRVNIIRALHMRGSPDSFPYLLKELSYPNKNVRLSTWNALGAIVGSTDVQALIEALDKIGDNGSEERRFASQAIINACDAAPSPEAKTRAVLAAVGQVEKEDTKKALLQIAARLSTPQALLRLKNLLRDRTLGITAAKAMGDWQTAEPMPDLLEFIRSATGDGEKLVALQSLGLIASRPSSKPHAETIKILSEAIENVPPRRTREKNQLLAGIALLPDPTAMPTVERLAGEELKQLVPNYKKENDAALARQVAVQGETVLPASKASVFGQGARLSDGIVTDWRGTDSSVQWEISIPKAGKYNLSIEQASDDQDHGAFRVLVAGESINGQPKDTGGDFKEVSLGTIQFRQAGNYSLAIQPLRIPEDGSLMQLQSIKLTPK